LDGERLYFFKSQTDLHKPKIISLFGSKVKSVSETNSVTKFELITLNETFNFKADKVEATKWIQHLNTISKNLIEKSLGSEAQNKDVETSSADDPTVDKKGIFHMMTENNECADCNEKNPEWISLNLGVFFVFEML